MEKKPKEITIDRSFAAPREKVFNAWIEPKAVMEWFHAEEGWTTPFAEIDPKVGGTFRIGFHSPNSTNDFVFEGTYNEVVSPERLVFTIGDGRRAGVTFKEDQGKTKLILVFEMEEINPEEQQRKGWTLMLVHLGEYLEKSSRRP